MQHELPGSILDRGGVLRACRDARRVGENAPGSMSSPQLRRYCSCNAEEAPRDLYYITVALQERAT